MTNSTNPIEEYKLFKNNLIKLFENIKVLINILKPMFNNGLEISCNLSKKITDIVCNFEDNIDKMYKYIDNKRLNINQIADLQNIVDKNKSNLEVLNQNLKPEKNITNDIKINDLEQSKVNTKILPHNIKIDDVSNEILSKVNIKSLPNNIKADDGSDKILNKVTINRLSNKIDTTSNKILNKGNNQKTSNNSKKKKRKKKKKHQRGGSNLIFEYITDPFSKNIYSIYSKKGLKILEKYIESK
uniref:Uncharacterized protein n=1 Tax=viral metagenome TaxID=1070528 RepID=A0A6C0IV77_9ZZZZ